MKALQIDLHYCGTLGLHYYHTTREMNVRKGKNIIPCIYYY